MLLGRYVAHGDEAAFAVLLQRHASMVLAVCRRVLGHVQDAEEAFQATFLLLARKASGIRKRDSVAAWLHGAAHRIALKARVQAARRRKRERAARPVENPEPAAALAWQELETVLDEELRRLPKRNHAPLVLFYLQGNTQEEIAAELGCPLGTVRSRLARGRDLLRKALARRGLTLSTAALATALAAHTASAAVPAALLLETAHAACRLAAGHAVGEVAAAPIAALATSGARTLRFHALHALVAVGLAAVAVAAMQIGRLDPRPVGVPMNPVPQSGDLAAARRKAHAFKTPLPAGARARIGTMRWRHEGGISESFAVAPDDRTIAIGSGRNVVLWDLATGDLRRRIPIAGEAQCPAFAPDGKSLAVGCGDGSIRIIDPDSGQELRRLVGHDSSGAPATGIYRLFFSANGSDLVSSANDGTRMWEVSTGNEIRTIAVPNLGVRAVCQPASLVAMGAANDWQTLEVWDIAHKRQVRALKHAAGIRAVTFSRDGGKLAVALLHNEPPGEILLWDLHGQGPAKTFPLPDATVSGLAFSPDGRTLAVSTWDNRLRLWDIVAGKELRSAPAGSAAIYQIEFTRDGKSIVFRSWFENRIHVWDVASWSERLDDDSPTSSVRSLAFSADGRMLAGGAIAGIWVWDALSGRKLATVHPPGEFTEVVSFTRDRGRPGRLVSIPFNGTVSVCDVAAGKALQQFKTGLIRVATAALSPDGRTLALCSTDDQQRIHLWDIDTRTELKCLDIPVEQPGVRALIIGGLCFSNDGKTLYGCTGFSLPCWDIATGKSLPSFGPHRGGVIDCAVTADDRCLAVLDLDRTIHLWEVASHQPRLIVCGKTSATAQEQPADGTRKPGVVVDDLEPLTTIALSSDARLLAVANNGRMLGSDKNGKYVRGYEGCETVTLIDAGNGKVLRKFTGHTGGVASLTFSPDGRTLASGGEDTTVILWDTSMSRPKPPVSLAEPDKLWEALRRDAAIAYESMIALESAPKPALELLRKKLHAPVAIQAAGFAKLIRSLDSQRFAEREAAAKQLIALGTSAEPSLRGAVRGALSSEARDHIEKILQDIAAERLRELRAIEVLEHIGNEGSRRFLHDLAGGTAGTVLTDGARAALGRLEAAH